MLATSVDEQEEEVKAAVGPCLYGVNHPGGAEMLVGVARAKAKQHPHYIMVNIDVNNAFGELDRATVLRRVADSMPKMTCLIASIFQPGTNNHKIEGGQGT